MRMLAADPPKEDRISTWQGHERRDFEVAGRNCLLIVPESPADGKPWIWRTEFFGHEPQADLALIEKGFHVTYIDVQNMYGAPVALDLMDAFYGHLTKDRGLSRKAVLEGFSRGGLFSLNWAARNPDQVACIYNDAPVCDFKSWPGGRGRGKGSPGDWKQCLEVYKLTEEQALAYKLNPVDNLAPLAKAKIPLLHVCGDADEAVPIEENTRLVEKRYKELGGPITVIAKPGVGHHPHSLVDPTPIVEFVLKHTIGSGSRAQATDSPATIQVKAEDVLDGGVIRQTVLFPGWDPYEPVSAYLYFAERAEKLPVVIFIHGMGADKSWQAPWHVELAQRGFAVISIDAHLSGDRKIATSIGGIKAEQDWVWPHQTVVNHTANDVSKILDVLPTQTQFDPTRVAVTGFSMGGAITMVLAWREPRISVVMPLCGCVDFWWDVTKIEPGPEQAAKIVEFSARLKQLTGSLDSNTPSRMDLIAPKALLLLNGTKDGGIDIRSIRKFADDMRPRYKDIPDRLGFYEDPNVGHDFSPQIKQRATAWLVQHLIEKPIIVRLPD